MSERNNVAEQQLGTSTAPAPATEPRLIHRCSECFAELYDAERGYGSTALACPEHGFDRQIVTVPAWVEGAAKDHPAITRRYVEWLLEPARAT